MITGGNRYMSLGYIPTNTDGWPAGHNVHFHPISVVTLRNATISIDLDGAQVSREKKITYQS